MTDARRPSAGSENKAIHTPARITVIAGVNGAGKSSVVGASIRLAGGRYFNPDEAAAALMRDNPALLQAKANARAWEAGRRALEQAILENEHFTLETTLGGTTITRLLTRALDAGLEVVMRFVGLESPELHIQRVQQRVALGGHDIPAAKIRERYTTSREHLIELLPRLTELVVYDNSTDGNPHRGGVPAPTPLLKMVNGRIEFLASKDQIPGWARPIAAAAILSHHNRDDELTDRPSL